MKSKLNLTIEENILQKIKSYAVAKQTSLSELVEKYFEQLTEAPAKPSIFEFIKDIKPSSYSENFDFKKSYFEQLNGKEDEV